MVSCCLSATGIRFSVIRFPPRNWALLTVGSPAQRPDPDGVTAFRTHELAIGVGALWTPGTTVLTPTKATKGRAPAASQRPVPAPRSNTPPRGASHNEASTRVQAIHPSDLPLTCDRPDGTRQPLGLNPGLRTPPTKSRQRTPRWGQAIEHGPGTTAQLTSVDLQSDSSLVTCDLASHVANGIAGRNPVSAKEIARDVGGVRD